jgi:hypothetical protein
MKTESARSLHGESLGASQIPPGLQWAMNFWEYALGLLPVEIRRKMGESDRMLQDLPPKKRFQDNWDTGAREGYEDRGAFRAPRVKDRREGSSVLRTVGGLAILGGIFWGVYLVTRGAGAAAALQENHGPIAIIGLGIVVSILGKYLRV